MGTLSFLSLPPLLLHVILVSFPLPFKLNLCRLFLWLRLHGPFLSVGVSLSSHILPLSSLICCHSVSHSLYVDDPQTFTSHLDNSLKLQTHVIKTDRKLFLFLPGTSNSVWNQMHPPAFCISVDGTTINPDILVNSVKFAAAAAAAKSLHSCPTPCSRIDGSPPGFPVPGILQARTLEWVAISFSNAWKWKWSRSVMSDS